MNPVEASPASLPFGDYLVFVDESGDHELTKINLEFPVFVLLFSIIPKSVYVNSVCRDLQRFKLDFWGHDEVVLHEHEIRKPRGDFSILIQREVRDRFLTRLTALMDALPATIIAVVIDKVEFDHRYARPLSPYDYAMENGLERVFRELESLQQTGRTTPIIVERRGRREDKELELAFHRVCAGTNALRRQFPFQLIMSSKASNSAGLQLTDLMARPVALRHLRPQTANRAYEIIAKKLRKGPDGRIEGYGLKIIP